MNHFLWIFSVLMMFLLGQFIHAWLRAQAVINSKLNGIMTYRQYIDSNSAALAARLFGAVLLLLAFSQYHQAIIGFAESHWTSLKSLGVDPLPVNPFSAGVLGWFGDSLLDTAVGFAAKRFPQLQKEIPPEPGTPPKVG